MKKLIRKRGFTLIELMIVVAIIGILAAIAIPNFIRFQARSKQGEAKSNLKALFTAQRSFFQEKDRYTENIREMGFSPERGNRYYYQVGAGAAEDRSVAPAITTPNDSGITVDKFKYTTVPVANPAYAGTAMTWAPAAGQALPPAAPPGGVTPPPSCPVCEFVGFATGNVDNENAGLDSWYIASVDSTNTPFNAPAVENVPAGQPQNTFNDVNND